MSLGDSVYKLLLAKGDTVPLVKEKTIGDLTPGIIGVFNEDTHLSVNKDIENLNRFYLAVGTGEGNTFQSFDKSAGQVISTKDLIQYSKFDNKDEVKTNGILDGSKVYTNKNYSILLELRSKEHDNQFGYNPLRWRYHVRIPSAVDKQTNYNSFILKFYKLINAGGVFKATLLKQNNTEVVTETDINTFIGTNGDPNSEVYFKLKVEPKQREIRNVEPVNLRYYYPRNPYVRFIFQDDELTNRKQVDISFTHSTGKGYDIKQKEYYSNSWEKSPYKLHSVVEASKNEEYFTNDKKMYDQVVIRYNSIRTASSKTYEDDITTIVAFEKHNDSTALNGFLEIMDAITGERGFKSLAPEPEAENQNA